MCPDVSHQGRETSARRCADEKRKADGPVIGAGCLRSLEARIEVLLLVQLLRFQLGDSNKEAAARSGDGALQKVATNFQAVSSTTDQPAWAPPGSVACTLPS